MATAGGWRISSGSWVQSVYYRENILMHLWRSAVLGLLRAALREGRLRTMMTVDEMETMLAGQERWWSVKVQTINSAEHFFQYGGRYARRPVIAQSRITDLDLDSQTVQFSAKDKHSGKFVQIRCSLEKLIDLWAQHILKRYKHAVRYFGLFAPRAVNQMFDRIFSAIGCKRQQHPDPPRWANSLKEITGRIRSSIQPVSGCIGYAVWRRKPRSIPIRHTALAFYECRSRDSAPSHNKFSLTYDVYILIFLLIKFTFAILC